MFLFGFGVFFVCLGFFSAEMYLQHSSATQINSILKKNILAHIFQYKTASKFTLFVPLTPPVVIQYNYYKKDKIDKIIKRK